MVRYKSVTSKGTKLAYRYICPNYANLLQRSGCSYKYLPDEDLKNVLGRLIAQEAALAVDAAALLEQKRDTGPTVIDLKLARAKTEWDSLARLRERLMRDFLAGVLSKEDHDRMKQQYAQEAADLEQRQSGADPRADAGPGGADHSLCGQPCGDPAQVPG